MDYYEEFAFGDNPKMADELLSLVLAGKKTATTSAMPEYELENDRIPKVGDVSLVLDGAGKPACVIETKCVTVLPFKDVTWEMAKREGEDTVMESWREHHTSFFTRNAAKYGYAFSEDMIVVFEEFAVTEIL
ncbi:RNA-binding protein [Clostridia bacterium]|nr:RNA-binding protein [Clostridia bacterium]